MKTVVMLVVSNDKGMNPHARYMAEQLALKNGHVVIAAAATEAEGSVRTQVAAGADRIVLVPWEIPAPEAFQSAMVDLLKACETAHPSVQFGFSGGIEGENRLIELIGDRIQTEIDLLEGTSKQPILTIEGRAVPPAPLDIRDLSSMPGQVEDVSLIVPGRAGVAVRVQSLVDWLLLPADVTHAVSHASDGLFSAKVPLAEARKGLLVYGVDGRPLSPQSGGPIRLVIPDSDDRCANVKSVARIEFVAQP
jgi:hypothetical protein